VCVYIVRTGARRTAGFLSGFGRKSDFSEQPLSAFAHGPIVVAGIQRRRPRTHAAHSETKIRFWFPFISRGKKEPYFRARARLRGQKRPYTDDADNGNRHRRITGAAVLSARPSSRCIRAAAAAVNKARIIRARGCCRRSHYIARPLSLSYYGYLRNTKEYDRGALERPSYVRNLSTE